LTSLVDLRSRSASTATVREIGAQGFASVYEGDTSGVRTEANLFRQVDLISCILARPLEKP